MLSNNVIQKNQMKLFTYMFIMTAIIGTLGYYVSSIFNWGLAGIGGFLIFAGILDFVAYFFSDTFVVKSTKAQPINEEAMPEYYALVREMCQRNNLKMPRLYIVNTDAMNAFATGRNKDRALVAVTSGLLRRLSPNEISGVVAHELSHIENYDMLIMSAISILAGFISILSNVFLRSSLMGRGSNRGNSGLLVIIGLALAILAPLSAGLIKMAVSRSREYMADAKGAKICGNPLYLASALEKIKGDSIPTDNASTATAHLYFSNPFKKKGFAELMSTHPNIDDRIKKLKEMSA